MTVSPADQSREGTTTIADLRVFVEDDQDIPVSGASVIVSGPASLITLTGYDGYALFPDTVITLPAGTQSSALDISAEADGRGSLDYQIPVTRV